MEEYIARLNTERFRTLLATELDAAARKILLQLLAEEERKLAVLRSACESRKPEGKTLGRRRRQDDLGR